MSKSKRKNQGPYQPPTPPRWKGSDSLHLAYQLNHRFFKLVSEMAAGVDVGNWAFIAQDRELWSHLNGETLERAARFPFVILDVFFANDEWWRGVIEGDPAPAEANGWPASVSVQLMSETLVFAWHTAKWDRSVARLSLGMSPGVAKRIAAQTPEQLASISAKHSSALRLRWQDDRPFWTRLLTAARDGNEEVLSDIHLHANLLLAGELMAG